MINTLLRLILSISLFFIATTSNIITAQNSGCMDTLACNYDSLAIVDDSSCVYSSSSITNIISNNSITWNGSTYIQSGTYTYSGGVNNNYSMSFDGINDIVNIDPPTNLNSYTINTWVFIDSTELDYKPILWIGDSDSSALEIYGQWDGNSSSSGNHALTVAHNRGSSSQAWQYFTTLDTYFNQWLFLTVTYDTGHVSVYFNGVQQLSSIGSGNFEDLQIGVNYDLYFGYLNWPNSSLHYLDGNLDNISIWNTVLSQSEIQNYMNCSPTGSESGLVGYWNFEEGSGTTIYDQTSNGNNGIINGATYATNVHAQSCNLTNSSGCDSTATVNIIIADNLFFSEYAEGSSNNKYFEIYNPTNDTISLINYAFGRVNNNPTTVGVYEYWVNFDSSSVIFPNDVFLVAHQSSDSVILAEADMFYGSLSNGDDGMALICGSEPSTPISPDSGSYIVLDWIGDWNGDPGQGWNVAGVNSATRDHTLIRKCPVIQGDTSWSNSAGISSVFSQWIVLPQNDWSNIGFHNVCVCDSSTNVYTYLNETICNGLFITVGNNVYDSTGIYSDTLLALNGCDSIITTNLIVLSASASATTNNITVCDGDSVMIGSSVYFFTGSYIDTLTNLSGCDSIITSNIVFQTPVNQNITICIGDSFLVGNSTYTSGGNYVDTLQSSIGCDSIIYTNLTIYSQFNSIYGGISNNTIGGGAFYSGSQYLMMSCYIPSELVSAVVYAEDTVTETFEIRDDNANVLFDTLVTVYPGGQRIYFNYILSVGSDYQLGVNGNSNNLFRNNSGVNYPYNFGSLASLTSSSANSNPLGFYYYYYDIEVKQSTQPVNYSLCDGQDITIAGSTYNTTGLYTDSLISSQGCDSVVLTNLIVHPAWLYTNTQTICSGETYIIAGNIYDSTGIYIDSLFSQYGCDSIVSTNLTVNSFTGGSGIDQQTICFGDSVTVGSNTYFDAGVFIDTLISSNGCDSIHTTYIDVITANYSIFNIGLLDTLATSGSFSDYDGYLILDATTSSIIKSANVYSDDTNTVTFELRDNNGLVLDNVSHLLYPGIQNVIFDFLLPVGNGYQLGVDASNNNIGLYRSNDSIPYPFSIGAVTISNSNAGNQYYYYYYDIEVMPLTNSNSYNICDGDSVTIGNNIYTIAGDYTDTFVSSNGCDSIVNTSLSIYETSLLLIGSVPSPAEICLGDTILLEASQGFSSYQWSNNMIGYLIYITPLFDQNYNLVAVDSNNCLVQAEVAVKVDSCVSSAQKSIHNEVLKIYPNPTSDYLTINFSSEATKISIYNMIGELVFSENINKGESLYRLNIESWQAAIYNIQLHRDDILITNKQLSIVK